MLKYGNFSSIDLLKMVVNELLLCGLNLSGYGYFKD